MSGSRLEAINHDNRGTKDVTFGFVYFNDGTRALYTGTTGAELGTGGWEAVTREHVLVADIYLNARDMLRTERVNVSADDATS